MSDGYRNLQQQAEKGVAMFLRMLDRPSHVMAALLQKEMQALLNDVRGNRHPRGLEDRVRIIQRHLLQARRPETEVMRIEENVDLHQHYEAMRMMLRRLPNY